VEDVKTPRILNKEVLLLTVLAIIAVGAFIFTRHVAAREHLLEAQIAAFWYQRGMQYLQSGENDKAIQWFRKSTASAPDNERYVLALAAALAAGNHDAEAEQMLLGLREADPANTEINSQLARLSAKQGSVADAVHYYQSALYANSAPAQAAVRRQLRIEFIRFLLAHQQRELAASELLVLQSRTPNSPAAHIETARMFVAADDPARAFEEYRRAAQLDDSNVEALGGAGETAFQIGDYISARSYLRAALHANPGDEKARQLLTLTEMIEREDPLAAGLTPGAGLQRLVAGLERSRQRLERCPSQPADSQAGAEIQALKSEAAAAENKLRAARQPADVQALQAGVELIFRMQQAAAGYCGKAAAEDEALLMIGRQHHGEQP